MIRTPECVRIRLVLVRYAVSTNVASLIEVDAQGVAWIAGANTRVIEVVLDKLAYGWSPEEKR